MNGNYLVKIIEHNNWANSETIQTCAGRSDEQMIYKKGITDE